VADGRLLLATLAPACTREATERVRTAAAAVRNWPELLRLAGRHEVIAPFHRSLAGSAADRLPPGILAVLEDRVRRQSVLGRTAWDELSGLLELFGAAGLSVMPFKGPVLAHRLYGDWGARVSHDLDFLVRTEHVPRILSDLDGAGYHEPEHARLSPAQAAAMRSLYGELAYTQAGRLTVEPHWALAQSTQAIDLDYEAMWRRATRVEIEGVELIAPDPRDLFVMLVVHGSKELWRSAKWLADFVAFVHAERTLDWSGILEHARAAGILRMVHVGFLLAERTTGTSVPEPFRRSIERDPQAERLAASIEARLLDGAAEATRTDRLSSLRWRLRERRRDRLRYAWRTVTTPRPRHYGIVRLPDSLIAGYVPVKLVHDYVFAPALRLVRGRT
jgi:hypothetical protein